jgi:basic membrane lipoprotein Med (substrate-binding protein (PBP1-ABC) superfamily)
LTSINGITEDGELVNVDSVGNRVAALTYGPDNVFAFVSMKKVYGDLKTTVEMVRRNTAPSNAHRLGLEKDAVYQKRNYVEIVYKGRMYLQYHRNNATINDEGSDFYLFNY